MNGLLKLEMKEKTETAKLFLEALTGHIAAARAALEAGDMTGLSKAASDAAWAAGQLDKACDRASMCENMAMLLEHAGIE